MKKVFLSSIVLMMALVAQAQVKVAPKLQNGFKAVYTEVSTASVAGTEETTTTETEYVVSDVTANGAVITATLVDIKSDEGQSDAMSALLTMGESIMKGISIKMSTDADGQVTGILNLDEVKKKATEMASTIVEGMLKENPEVEQVMSKETLMAQMTNSFTEEALMNSIKSAGVLALNGKTINSGATENVVNEQGMNMKRMYFVTGKNIIANSTLDMSKDQLKAFIIKQVSAVSPDQAEMVKDNIDLVMGQMKFNATTKSTYELQDNGWVKSLKTETSTDVMGQAQKRTSVITLK
ncbi:MAG: hypothetical protein K6D37_08580 [Prevotella sp.]|nr:hypothetical protein [Prevotella sp.]